MKVTGIHIGDFHQFKNLDIDLTYPAGHKRAGEPLDKVCIIGQSGTGKTKLLEIIRGLTYYFYPIVNKYGFTKKNGHLDIKNFDITYTQTINEDSDDKTFEVDNQKKKSEDISFESFIVEDSHNHSIVNPYLIFYPAGLNYEVSEAKVEDFKEKKVIDFSRHAASSIWNIILKEIQKYQEQENALRLQLSMVVEDNKNDINAITAALKVLEEWQKNNFNPITDLAEKCLNPILERFHLRVKTKLDIKRKDDIGFIKIEDFSGNEIPYGLWSTGTKQVVLSALPLYLLKPNHTIILFDEPERSLYPDLQKLIIDYYQQLTTDCQMFFATHSPIIASSFEPWEIIELKFNKEGHVYQEQYYEGERHIDNYIISPDHLTYDLMLSKVFDVQETHSPVREEKITEVLMLRNQLERLKKEGKLATPQGETIYDRYMKLAQKLAWDFELPQYEKA